MKKRLLSAALALAIVLTLLPMGAFAAEATAGLPESGKTSVQYVPKTDNSKLDINGKPIPGDTWAWQYKVDNKTYWTSSSGLGGLVNGTNASGVWYASVSDFLNDKGVLRSNNITLVGDATISGSSINTTLSVNVFGNNLSITGDIRKVNTITITDTYKTTYNGTPGTVSIPERDVQYYATDVDKDTKSTSGLTLSVTGATVTGGISLLGRSNKVTLTGAAVSGGIKLDGTTWTKNKSTDTNWTKAFNAQTLTTAATRQTTGVPIFRPSVSGAIDVIGNASQITLADVNGAAAGGGLNSSTPTGSVTVTSTGGKVQVDGASCLGDITVQSGNAAAKDAPATVTINGGKTGNILRAYEDTSTTAGSITVNIGGETGYISTYNGTVAVHSAKTGNIQVDQGTLTIDGANAKVGNLTLANGGKTTFNFTGTGHEVGNITTTKGANLTIGANWPADRTNTFGTLSLNGSTEYTGQGIKGGIFKTEADDSKKALWFSPDLQFMRLTTNGSYAYYGKKELSAAIADAGTAAAREGTINVVGYHGSISEPLKYVQFYNSSLDAFNDNPVARLGYGVTTAIYLPDKINGTSVATWTNEKEAKTYSVNEQVSLSRAVSNGNIQLVLQSSGATVSKLTNATISGVPSLGDVDANVTVTLTNNQVVLSGAVSQGSFADVKVKFTTDVIGSDGNPVTFEVPVAFDTTGKTATFSTLGLTNIPAGVTVNNTNIVVSGTTYTLNTSGLAKPASNLKIAGIDFAYGSGNEVIVTVNGSMTAAAKEDLIKQIDLKNFNWTNSAAVRQAINAAMATITNNSQLDNWVTTAQRAAWNLKNKGTPTAQDLSDTGFNTVVLVPYLAVTVTGSFYQSGTMTATLVPSYRVEVWQSSANTYAGVFKYQTNGTDAGNYLAQTGRALGALNNDLETYVEVDIDGSLFNNAYAHQDDTYVYQISSGKLKLTHGGKSSGLGTLVINKTDPLMRLVDKDGNFKGYYDVLQAAVDDAEQDDVITIYPAYNGTGVINVTGVARKFTIRTEGNTSISAANNNFTVGVDTTGHEYTVQLQKSTVVTGNVVISVNSASNGSVTASASRATAGDTITLTAKPSSGYAISSITARTDTGANVSISSTTNANQWSFVVPTGASSITVTPSFATIGTATISVANVTNGAASASSSTARGGSTVTVYTVPNTGYQTTGVTVSTNVGSVNAVRTGTNQYQFTVPANATTVTVTPNFAVDTGLPFTDVSGTSSWLPYVQFVYKYGIMTGQTPTSFGGSYNLFRGDLVLMLYRLSNSPAVTNSNAFTDVKSTDYYNNAITWAVNNGIVQGRSTTIFDPKGYISRQELATVLYNYNKFRGGSTGGLNNLGGFTDRGSVSSYAVTPIQWAVGNGIINGTTSTTLTPGGYASRYQVATMLTRYCQSFLNMS